MLPGAHFSVETWQGWNSPFVEFCGISASAGLCGSTNTLQFWGFSASCGLFAKTKTFGFCSEVGWLGCMALKMGTPGTGSIVGKT